MEYYTQSTRNHNEIDELVTPWHWMVTEHEYIPAINETHIETECGWEGEVYEDIVTLPGDHSGAPEQALIENAENYQGSGGPITGGSFPKK